tara:strand:+ start:3309 stop:12509 length:9201 start_codon:yes stop_codon:yes gene_type:complete
MAKIKTTFIRGRMNKDLDERLLPKGEYRDARNIQVSTSEGSDVGTVQNILQNKKVDDIVPSGFICVGSIADEAQNKAYWFASSEDKDIIVEYDPALELSSLVFVDTNKRNSKACLKFDKKIITGINVIDNFILFTDGFNEPKKINIKRSKIGTIDIDTHTRLIINEKHSYNDNVGEVLEENITVIKKRPTKPLRVKINKSNTNKEKGIFEKIFPRFSYRYKYADNETSAYGPFTKPIFSANFTDDLNSLNFFDLKNGHNTSMVNTIKSIDIFDIIDDETPQDVISVDILFKRDDSNVVYVVENISSNKIKQYEENGFYGKYTVTTENIFSAIDEKQNLRIFDNVPKTALAQEVTGNRVVYGNYTQGFDVDNVEVNSNYFVKDFTNESFSQGGIESIKAQRDYQIGVVFGDYYGRETQVFTSNEGSVTVPWSDASKTQGPSYLEPLMLSSSLSTSFPSFAEYYKFYIKETSGEYFNLLMDRVYVPSLSTDYENEEDHVYLSFPSSEINKIQEDSYIILKKTSSSVEKPIEQLNRYKVIDISPEAPDAVAFMYLSTGETSNLSNNDNLSDLSTEGVGLFISQTNRIDNVTDLLEISATEWINGGNSPLPGMEVSDENFSSELDASDYYVSWKRVSASGKETHSRRYRVVNVSQGATTKIKLQEKISIEDAKLAYDNLGTDADGDDSTTNAIPDYANNATSSADKLHPDLVFSIKRKVKKDGEDFSGKFFVKVLADEILKENLTNFNSKNTSEFISSSNDTFWWGDVANADGNEDLGINTIYGNTPNTQPGAAGDPTNTVTEWDSLLATHGKAMFIDNMSMVASNLSSSNYAKHSGQGVRANEVIYSENEWNQETTWSSSNEYSSETMSAVVDLSVEQEDWINNIVNSMHGILQINSSYTEGANAWKKDIYSQELDSVYGEDEDAFFMHFSFFAPGKDLHDGSGFGDSDAPLDEVEIDGENSIASLLKGIWGGGAFQYDEDKFVEFEGNYLDDDALAEAPGPNVGSGYDVDFKELHERQWEPTFSPNSTSFNSDTEIDEDLESFIQNIKIGKKFKFENDSNNETYTILDVSVKHIYNHTPWRSRYINHSVNGISRAGDSVEEAARLWAKAKAEDIDQVPSAETNDVSPAQNLVNKITAFGKASNRRTCYIVRLDKNPASADNNPIDGASGGIDLDTSTNIQFIDTQAQAQSGLVKNISAIFETEPKDSLDLNIFYEASQAIPTYLTHRNAQGFAPPGCRVEFLNLPQAKRGQHIITDNLILAEWDEDGEDLYFKVINENSVDEYTEVTTVGDNTITKINVEDYYADIEDNPKVFNSLNSNSVSIQYSNAIVRFYREDGSYTSCRISTNNDDYNPGIEDNQNRYAFVVDKNIDPGLSVGLNWFNCFSFGNGVESNRIRDDFNAPFISNGARASTTLDESYNYAEERKYGLIYSGIYNAPSGVNKLNQFIAAEKITKDLNPTYGSIQKLFSRRADLIAFCEDRVVKILANKDALFNADGNVNLVATENVLGQASPFVGEYGISQNPESFAKESYRAYFSDKNRGTVLRLSMDGLTPISDAGMHDYFRDELPKYGTLIGTYDDYKKQYNLSFGLARYNNILLNSFISEGETLNESISTFQIIENGDLNASEEVQLVDVNVLYENNAIVSNEEMLHDVTIVNWPAIQPGQIGNYYSNQILPDTASLQYTLTSEDWNVQGYADAQGNPVDGNSYIVYSDTLAVDAVFPAFQVSNRYIIRNEGTGANGVMNLNPFNTLTAGHGCTINPYGVQYIRNLGSSDTEVKHDGLGDSNDGGSWASGDPVNINSSTYGIVLAKDANDSNYSYEGFTFPYKHGFADGSSSTYESPIEQHPNTHDAIDALNIGSSKSCTQVFNGEVINVKVNYRLRRRFIAGVTEPFKANRMKVELIPSWAPANYENSFYALCSNTFGTTTTAWGTTGGDGSLGGGNNQLGATSAGIGAGTQYQGAPNANPWFGNDNNSGAGGADLIQFPGYTSPGSFPDTASANAEAYATNLALYNIATAAGSSMSFEFDTNPNLYTPQKDSGTSWWTDNVNADLVWEGTAGSYGATGGGHAPIYSEQRQVVFQFRIFDADDPWTPKIVAPDIKVELEFQVDRANTVAVTGVAMWKSQQGYASLGSNYVPVVVNGVQTPTDSVELWGFDPATTETITLEGQAAIDAFEADPTLSNYENIVASDTTSQDTQVTVSSIVYDPPDFEDPVPIPAEEIPAFAEVINLSTPGFSFNAPVDPYVMWNTMYGQPQGEWVEVTVTDAEGNDQVVKYRQPVAGTGTGVLPYNYYSGDPIDSFEGEALGDHYIGSNTYANQTTFQPYDNSSQVGSAGISFSPPSDDFGDAFWIIENEDGSDLLSMGEDGQGRFYLVDLFYNEQLHPDDQITPPTLGSRALLNNRRIRLDGVLDPGIASQCDYETQSLQVENSQYPVGHFGQIAHFANNDCDLIPLPVTVTEYGVERKALRAIFKTNLNSNQDLNKLRIRDFGQGPEFINFTGVQIIDITQADDPGGFSEYWSTNTFYTPVHALEPLSAYYGYNGWNFDIPATEIATSDGEGPIFENYLQYVFNNSEFADITTDDVIYTLSTNVAGEGQSGQFNGQCYITLTTPPQSDGTIKRLSFRYNDASVEGNTQSVSFTNNGNFELVVPYDIDDSNVVVQNTTGAAYPYSVAEVNNGGIKVVMMDDASGINNSRCKINFIKLYTQSTIVSGGGTNGWLTNSVNLIEGSNPFAFSGPMTPITTQDYIYFENEQIKLDNAPAGTQIYQFLEEELQIGNEYNINFNLTSNEIPLEIYYWSPNSVAGNAIGFKYIFSDSFITDDGFGNNTVFSNILNLFPILPLNVTVEQTSSAEDFNPESDLTGCLVIRVLPSQLNNGFYTASIDDIVFSQIDTTNLIPETVSYEESVKGWVSFKDFKTNNNKGIESGLSLSKKYYTYVDGKMWQHYKGDRYSQFYNDNKLAHVTTVINDAPDVVKEFKTLDYEGSNAHSYIPNSFLENQQDGFNTQGSGGWYCSNIKTNIETGELKYFLKKEGKWFNYIRGTMGVKSSIREGKLNAQGLGMITSLVLISDE